MSCNRRQFIKSAGTGALALAVVAVARPGQVRGQDALPLLGEDEPTAKALGYVDDVAKVPAGEPLLKPDAICANCLHYKGAETDPVAPCALFPGKAVPARAWCKAWAIKPAA